MVKKYINRYDQFAASLGSSNLLFKPFRGVMWNFDAANVECNLITNLHHTALINVTFNTREIRL